MALGYRYLYGEGVPENCETALVHYEYAANEAALQIEKRGYPLPIERNRLSDDTAAAVRSSGAAGSEVDLEVNFIYLIISSIYLFIYLFISFLFRL